MNEQTYILLDSKSVPLAKGVLMSPPGAEKLQLRVLEDQAGEVALHEVIQLIGMGAGTASLRCHLIRQRGDQLVLERMEILNPELRRSLRIPVCFDSFLYPITGRWKGRRLIRSIDLSCGGVAFYAEPGLEPGERAEVVIPTIDQPLLLRIQILRLRELKNERTYYSAKFIDMCTDEENKVCEAVFSIQLQNRKRTASEQREDEKNGA